MDDDLTRRLAALRYSLEPQGAVPPAPKSTLENEEDALTIRFEQIFNKSPVSKVGKGLSEKGITKRSYETELSAEELINALSSEESWAIEQIDKNEIQQLLEEAKIPISPRYTETKGKEENGTGAMPDWFQGDILEDIKSDSDTEEDILRIIKDEIEYEVAHGILSNDNDEEKPEESYREGKPTPPKAGPDEDLLKRFEALGGLELPPTPRIEPVIKQRPVPPVTAPELDESDTWCCICNENAEYRCSGCENDIYCTSCLYEAHTGPNSGYEERRHKWTKYTRPKRLASC